MKVFCINSDGWACTKKFVFGMVWISKVSGPAYGEICDVSEEGETDGRKWYELKGWTGRWEANCFIPILDEEIEQEEELVEIDDAPNYKPWPVDKAIKHLV